MTFVGSVALRVSAVLTLAHYDAGPDILESHAIPDGVHIPVDIFTSRPRGADDVVLDRLRRRDRDGGFGLV